jgi:acyl-CoA synthetase (NDP forming)
MDFFFNPRSVAIIGASLTFGKAGNLCLWNLVNLGYEGRVYPVNPRVKEGRKAYGVPFYRSIRDVPDDVDLVILAIPRDLVLGAVKECAERDVKGIVILAGGLSDAGDEGREIEEKILKIAKDRNISILGPNSQGLLDVHARFAVSFTPLKDIKAGGVAILSQTGIFIASSKFFAEQVHGLSKLVDLANMCDVDYSDFMDYLGKDERTKVIAIHLEGFRKNQGRKFFSSAKALSGKKPVIILRAGRSEEAKKAIISHTGTLAGDDETIEAALRQSGVIGVSDLDELIDLAKAFHLLPLMKGPNIGIVTHTGGMGALSVDACSRYGMRVAELSSRTRKGIEALSPEWLKISNPVDIWPAIEEHGHKKAYEESIELVLKDENVDGLLVIMPVFPGVFDASESIIKLSKNCGKPIVIWAMPVVIKGRASEEGIKRIYQIEREGIAVYPSPRRAIHALSALYRYWKLRS